MDYKIITVLVTKIVYRIFEDLFSDRFTQSNYFSHYLHLNWRSPQHSIQLFFWSRPQNQSFGIKMKDSISS